MARGDQLEQHAGFGQFLGDVSEVIEDREADRIGRAWRSCFRGQLATNDLEPLHEIGGAGKQDAPSIARPGQARPLPTDGFLPPPGKSVTMPGVRRSRSGSHYPFHPRCGQMVPVMFRRRFAGEDHLVVVQPDSTLALVPSWMAEAVAGSATLRTCPRLSVGRLVELRARLDALLTSSDEGIGPARRGGDHAPTIQPAGGLFEADRTLTRSFQLRRGASLSA